jgi:hypothetical protein
VIPCHNSALASRAADPQRGCGSRIRGAGGRNAAQETDNVFRLSTRKTRVPNSQCVRRPIVVHCSWEDVHFLAAEKPAL